MASITFGGSEGMAYTNINMINLVKKNGFVFMQNYANLFDIWVSCNDGPPSRVFSRYGT